MRALSFALAAAVTLASAGLAFAQDRITDSQYLAAARCTGLAQGAGESAEAFENFYKAQSKRRPTFISEQAEKARDKARHSAKIANETQRGVFTQELAGACAAYRAS